MPKLQFLTVCESAGTLTEKNVCKVVSINTDPFAKKKNPGIEQVLSKNKKKDRVQAAVWLENKSLAKQCPW